MLLPEESKIHSGFEHYDETVYGEIFVRQSILTAKCLHREMSLQSVLKAKCPTAKCPTAKSPTAKSPVMHMFMVYISI